MHTHGRYQTYYYKNHQNQSICVEVIVLQQCHFLRHGVLLYQLQFILQNYVSERCKKYSLWAIRLVRASFCVPLFMAQYSTIAQQPLHFGVAAGRPGLLTVAVSWMLADWLDAAAAAAADAGAH